MSGPRIKVKPVRWGVTGILGFRWDCSQHGGHVSGTRIGYWKPGQTIAQAADAGRAHLREHHTPPTTPLVVSITNGSRCTCADLPAPNWPYFTPCPVHTYLVNTTNAVSTGTYCRAHGCHGSECGCLAEHGDCAGTERPETAESRSDFVSTISEGIQRAHERSRNDA